MNRRLMSAALLALAVAALLVTLPTDSRGEPRHISLVRSAPAKDTVLTTSPPEIRLWFSGIPQEGATSIRLLDSSAEPVSVHVAAAVASPEDGTVHFARVHGTLPSGRYTVAWATVAQDGAAARGEIPFSVRSP